MGAQTQEGEGRRDGRKEGREGEKENLRKYLIVWEGLYII